MRKTILLAIIACVLGIVLLAALAFYIPNEFGNKGDGEQSELFTGFQISTEDKKRPSQTVSEHTAPDSEESESASREALPNDTLPDSEPQQVISETEKAEQTEQAEQADSGQKAKTDETELPDENVKHFDQLPSRVKAHRIIWVGDSRTLGLGNALHKVERVDDDLFIGQVGEGVRWFREEGMSQLSDAIAEHPDLPVVMNFGVNDPQLINDYVVAYWDVIRAHPDTHFYILSVNPLDEEFLIEDGQVADSVFDDINSLNVARMNVKLKDEFGSRYIDSASFLKADGFETVDGLHFSTNTYLKIHDFVVNKLF